METGGHRKGCWKGLKKKGRARNIFRVLSQARPVPDLPAILEHDLTPFFPQLRSFPSIATLEASPLYARVRPELERILESVVQENLPTTPLVRRPSIRATAWNIERGLRLKSIIEVLREHPLIRQSDVFLLTELDCGMARTQNRFVAREIAKALRLNYAFACCYLNLEKGSGLEKETPGRNAQALHGNALFSRHPILDSHSIALPNGKDKLKGREKRLGCQRAVVATMAHPSGPLRAVSLHLDAHSSQRQRQQQMTVVLDHLEKLPPLPELIGGDWNTTTYNSRRALYSILGYCRRVLLGVRNVIENHYPYPERWFERNLFRTLEERGYQYRELNEPGSCTLHYDVNHLGVKENLADWIPSWCFWFINWALKKQEGRCSLKLDWFAGKGIVPEAAHPPTVVHNLGDQEGRISDHDPIVVDFRLPGWGDNSGLAVDGQRFGDV